MLVEIVVALLGGLAGLIAATLLSIEMTLEVCKCRAIVVHSGHRIIKAIYDATLAHRPSFVHRSALIGVIML